MNFRNEKKKEIERNTWLQEIDVNGQKEREREDRDTEKKLNFV